MIRLLLQYFLFIISTILLNMSIPVEASTFSGKVVDEAGNDIPEFTIALEPSVIDQHIHQHHLIQGIAGGPLFSKTEPTGRFSIQDIQSRIPYELVLLPRHEFDYEIRGVEIDKIRILSRQRYIGRYDGLPFAIDENADIKDVVIIVRQRMRIRGQVLLPDGTPLKNERVNLRVKRRYLGGGTGSSGGTTTLDENGYFKRFVSQPANYTIIITYQDQTIESEEIRLNDGQRIDNITLTLKEKPKPKPEKIMAAKIQPAVNRAPVWKQKQNGVWVINPSNRHAYRRIYCQSYEEAMNKAKMFDAHLLTINNKEEQQWILDVFGLQNYWIGLTNNENKIWDNGDPVTYTNFDKPDKTLLDMKSKGNIEKKPNITALIGLTGKWMQMQQDSPITGLIQDTILEREHLTVDIPAPDDNN